MELLIPGLILVALMVWASTRIKRKAAQAFYAETINGDGFTLEKPDGFLQRIDSGNEFLFDAYSKDFGTGTADDIRAATAVVVGSDPQIDRAASLEQSRLFASERSEEFELGGHHCMIITGELDRDGHRLNVSEKLIEVDGQTLVLRIESLSELDDEMTRKIEQILLSFNPR